jgi:hypothetical protein
MACHSPTFKASQLITLLTPRREGRWKLPRPDRIIRLRALRWPAGCLYHRLCALRKLRIRNPSGRFALDGGSALAFLAR